MMAPGVYVQVPSALNTTDPHAADSARVRVGRVQRGRHLDVHPGRIIGIASFTYRVASSISGSASDDATVRIDVRGAADDSASTPTGTPVSIDVRANDPCSGCTLSGGSAPSSGTAVLSDGGIRYTPATGFSGTDTFSYTLTQGDASTTAEVTVSVLPEAVDDAVTTLLGTDVQLLPLDNDLCANCALIGVGTPTSGTASSDGDVVTYSPSSVGTATFSYAAEDGSGNAFVGLITVHVVSPPALADDEASTPSGTPAVV